MALPGFEECKTEPQRTNPKLSEGTTNWVTNLDTKGFIFHWAQHFCAFKVQLQSCTKQQGEPCTSAREPRLLTEDTNHGTHHKWLAATSAQHQVAEAWCRIQLSMAVLIKGECSPERLNSPHSWFYFLLIAWPKSHLPSQGPSPTALRRSGKSFLPLTLITQYLKHLMKKKKLRWCGLFQLQHFKLSKKKI